MLNMQFHLRPSFKWVIGKRKKCNGRELQKNMLKKKCIFIIISSCTCHNVGACMHMCNVCMCIVTYYF